MSTKDYSCDQERKVADFLGWDVVSGSGSRPCVPGDIQSQDWLGECKTHTESGKKITFDKDVWTKIQHEADVKHRIPVLIVDDGSQDIDRTWVLCREVSINFSNAGVADPEFNIRKNIIFDGSKHSDYIKSLYKKNGGGIVFDHMFTVVDWADAGKVVIMPLSTFKEVYNL